MTSRPTKDRLLDAAERLFARDGVQGARIRDVDGNELVDLCLGDTGAMAGHAPEPAVAAVRNRIARGARPSITRCSTSCAACPAWNRPAPPVRCPSHHDRSMGRASG